MDYTQLRAAVAANIEAQTIAQSYYEKAQAEAQQWEIRHQLALKEGCEESIRQAEFRKHVCATKVGNLKAVLEEQTYTLAILQHKLNLAQPKFGEFHTTHIQTYCELPSNLPAIDLQTKLRELERTMEAMNVQLLQQQAAIAKLLKENSAALAQVQTLLAGDSCQATPLISNTAIDTLIAYLEAGSNVPNEFTARKNHLLSNSPKPQTNVISLCVDTEFRGVKNKLNQY